MLFQPIEIHSLKLVGVKEKREIWNWIELDSFLKYQKTKGRSSLSEEMELTKSSFLNEIQTTIQSVFSISVLLVELSWVEFLCFTQLDFILCCCHIHIKFIQVQSVHSVQYIMDVLNSSANASAHTLLLKQAPFLSH